MRLTVVRKVVIGLAVIVGLGALSLLVVYDGLRDLQRTVHSLFQIEEPTAAAAYEMEINVLGVGMGVLRYLEHPEPGNRRRVGEDDREFRQFHAQYAQLATTEQAQALAARLATLYAPFSDLGTRLMGTRDQEEALLTTVTRNIERMDEILDRRLQPGLEEASRGASDLVEMLLNVEADVAEVGIWLAHYQRFRKPEYRALIAENRRELLGGLARLVDSPNLTASERRWARELRRLTGETMRTIDDVLAVDDTVVRDRQQFNELRNTIDDLLDDEVQFLALRELRAPRVKADTDATAVLRMAGGLIPLFLLTAIGVGLMVTRGVSRPVQRLRHGTDAIGRGDLDYRLEAQGDDEFTDLARHFNRMVDQLQTTTVSKELLEASEARLKTSNEELRREMTERERAEAAQARLTAALQRSRVLAAMGSLVAGVAHEVRNPLFAIASTVDALDARLARQANHAEYVRHISVMRGEVERLSALMRELLEYGRPSGLDLAVQPIVPLVDRAVQACQPLASSAGVAIDARIPDLSVQADGTRVTQVIQNLLDNAIHHAPAGSTVSLHIDEIRENGHHWIECRVVDGGPGFRPEDLPRVFEPFFTRRRKGTGLGLSIVERIVTSHGGTVDAANGPAGGAVMTVRLPFHVTAGSASQADMGGPAAEDIVSVSKDSHRR